MIQGFATDSEFTSQLGLLLASLDTLAQFGNTLRRQGFLPATVGPALLGERDILRGAGADLHSRLVLLAGESRAARGAAQGGVQRARQLARQFHGYLKRRPSPQALSDPEHPRWLGALLAFAYPDRIAQQRRAGGAEYRLANGRAALFAEADALMKHAWLVVADLGSRQGQREERIYLAAELDPQLFDSVLAEQVSDLDVLDWDEREGVLRRGEALATGGDIYRRLPACTQCHGYALTGAAVMEKLALNRQLPAVMA